MTVCQRRRDRASSAGSRLRCSSSWASSRSSSGARWRRPWSRRSGPPARSPCACSSAPLILLAVARPRLSGHSRRAWGTVVLFGLALGADELVVLRLARPAADRRGRDDRVPRAARAHRGPLTPAALDFLAVVAAAARRRAHLRGPHRPLRRARPHRAGAGRPGAGPAGRHTSSCRSGPGPRFSQLDGLAIAMVVACLAVAPFGLGVGPAVDPGDPPQGARASRCCRRCCRTRSSCSRCGG